jgi:hypothetical protein
MHRIVVSRLIPGAALLNTPSKPRIVATALAGRHVDVLGHASRGVATSVTQATPRRIWKRFGSSGPQQAARRRGCDNPDFALDGKWRHAATARNSPGPDRTQEVAGSSPASSMVTKALLRWGFRSFQGWGWIGGDRAPSQALIVACASRLSFGCPDPGRGPMVGSTRREVGQGPPHHPQAQGQGH